MSGILTRRPKAVVLDVLGTIVPLDGVRAALASMGLADEKADIWFGRCQRDGFAAALTGRCITFKDIGSYHLQAIMQSAGAASAVTMLNFTRIYNGISVQFFILSLLQLNFFNALTSATSKREYPWQSFK